VQPGSQAIHHHALEAKRRATHRAELVRHQLEREPCPGGGAQQLVGLRPRALALGFHFDLQRQAELA
jgi:hypothetical protein